MTAPTWAVVYAFAGVFMALMGAPIAGLLFGVFACICLAEGMRQR
jgi:hypothetical protein